jgi:membrane-associated progesterone receptor component
MEITSEELAQYNGIDPAKPVYVGIKGTVFDVSINRDAYVGTGYAVFAGKDCSKALGKSSLKEEDCVADYSNLTPSELETLDKWFLFYKNKYPIVGTIN